MCRKILIVASHPDDEVLGCGGTIARLVQEECEAFTLILGEGMTAHDEKRDKDKRKKEVMALKDQAKKVGKILGIKKVFLFDLPDNRFDTVPFLDIVKIIEKIKKEIKPDIIFTHYEKDLNIDHQITYKAVVTATRPLEDETVREIYSFEIPSSTEWFYPLGFSPDIFFDISETIDIKLRAMEKYKGELEQYPHPRSLKGIKLIADMWGMRTGLRHAEAFKAVRIIK